MFLAHSRYRWSHVLWNSLYKPLLSVQFHAYTSNRWGKIHRKVRTGASTFSSHCTYKRNDRCEFNDSSLTQDATLTKAFNLVYGNTDGDNFVKARAVNGSPLSTRNNRRYSIADLEKRFRWEIDGWRTVWNFRRVLDCRRSTGLRYERNWINDQPVGCAAPETLHWEA